MLAYIFKRLLLMIPTLFGVLLMTFVVIQFVPGGPVEQMVAQLQGPTRAVRARRRRAAATGDARAWTRPALKKSKRFTALTNQPQSVSG